MSPIFRLYWLRETGCDAGTPLRADELDPEIQHSVLPLAGDDSGEITLMLPYIDRREWRKRGEILAALPWERLGDFIFPVLTPGTALRNAAANLVLTDPIWISSPGGGDPRYFAVWQQVSITLQRSLREWIAEEYFRDIARFEDREAAYSMIVYQAARVCRGRARGEFTYDLHDYPECRLTLALALRMTGRNLQGILAGVEQRLRTAGMPELARRYSPIWYQDMVVAVRKKPKAFIELLTAESAFINALTDLSLDQTPAGVHRFAKAANQALRKVYGMDVRHLGVRALEKATRVLAMPDPVPDGLGGGVAVEETHES